MYRAAGSGSAAGHAVDLRRIAMKIVVFGPDRRTGALRDGMIVDLCAAFAKYTYETTSEPHPFSLAEATVPSDLLRFIEGGSRALENAETAVNYLFTEAQDRRDRRGALIVHAPAESRLHAPRPEGARIACAGGNF